MWVKKATTVLAGEVFSPKFTTAGEHKEKLFISQRRVWEGGGDKN